MVTKPTKQKRSRKLKRVTSTFDLADLKRLEPQGIPAKQETNGLYLKDMHVAPRVFQWRLVNEDILASEQHVRELARVIQSKTPMKPLDPLVIGVGERFFVAEGHHRLDAYHTAGWKGRVPVEYFEGSIEAEQSKRSSATSRTDCLSPPPQRARQHGVSWCSATKAAN